ncbi:MAG: hypothetical protein CMP59_00455 [Flavobacteriales bacterium]|nr:hypothetical protein [Flavobacteriales bacterium]|tara:strand:+ start:1870 stop:2823 length:954 start_codon:yes stop_codon:yes gene_type:complete
MHLVSIIIPNFNNEAWLSTCLNSCLEQNGTFEKEIIVVDDQSTDSSWKILKSFQAKHPSEVFIFQNPKKGGNLARNFGFSKAKGDFIQWLDSDDILLPEKLSSQIEFLSMNEDIDIVYSDWRMDFYENGEKQREEVVISKPSASYLKTLILDDWQPPHSYLMRRKVAEKLDQIKGWNPKRKVGQDREYFNLAAIYGASFAYVPGLFSVYNRWSKNSVSSIDYMKRLELSLHLDQRLITEIQDQEWILPKTKKELIGILKTYSLKSCYYKPNLRILSPVGFGEIKWEVIHYKMRLIIPFIWLYQMSRFNIERWLRLRE